MAADHFCLKWNNFHSSIVTAFESLQSSEDLVDVTLMCEGRNVKAHKVILSACSPYFRNLFKETPCQHPIIILKDVLHCDLVAILQFMYQGEVLITQDGLASFLKTAELLQVSGLAGNSATVPEAPIVPTQVAVPVPTLLPIQPSPPSSPRAPQNKLHSEVTLKQTTSSKSSEKENSFSKKEVEAIRFTEPEVEPIQSCSYQQDAVIIKTEADEPEFQEVDDYRMRDENVDDPGPGAEEQSILERSLKAQGYPKYLVVRKFATSKDIKDTSKIISATPINCPKCSKRIAHKKNLKTHLLTCPRKNNNFSYLRKNT